LKVVILDQTRGTSLFSITAMKFQLTPLAASQGQAGAPETKII
jgi:hypothetical protein